MGRPPSSGGPSFRFTHAEVVEMEEHLRHLNNAIPLRDVIRGLVDKFTTYPARAGKISVQPKKQEVPAVLLVHVCGASLQHCRHNIGRIADEGHRVWAITLLGFRRSEKPNVDYTELLWSELLWDFIVDVVKEPFHLIGNSIGGYICAIAAGLWPSVANSLVLLNSAASVVPSYSFIPLSKLSRAYSTSIEFA